MIKSYKGFTFDKSYTTSIGETLVYVKDNLIVEIETLHGKLHWTVFKKGKSMPLWLGMGTSIEDCLDKASH